MILRPFDWASLGRSLATRRQGATLSYETIRSVNLPVDRSQNNYYLQCLSSRQVSSAEKAAKDVIFQGFAKARRAMRFEQNHDLSTLSNRKPLSG